jgi:hypothetical protein
MKKIIITVAFIVSAAGAFAQIVSTNNNGVNPVTNTVTPPTTTGPVAGSKIGKLNKDIKADEKAILADIANAKAEIKNLKADIKQRRLDIKNGDKAAAIALTKQIKADKASIRKDRKEIRRDMKSIRRDIRKEKRIARHEHHLSHAPNGTHKGAAPAK